VYAPAIRCPGKAALPDHITKLADMRDGLEEYNMAKKLHAIDPDRRYILYPTTICRIPDDISPEELTENPLYECSVPIRDPVLIQIPFGGQNLHTFVPRVADIPKFFEAVGQLLHAAEFLHSKDFIHMDMKPGNILIDAVGKKFRVRLIDFGLSYSVPAFADFTNIETLGADYYVWPYETRFLDPSFRRYEITEKSVKRFYRDAVEGFQPEVVPADLYFKEDGRDRMDMVQYREIFDFLDALPTEDRRRFIGTATDTYSLGRILSTLWANTTGHYPGPHKYSILFRQKDEAGASQHQHHDYTDAAFWTPRLGEAAYTWNANLAESVSIPLFALVRDMMAPFPFHRPTLQEAIERYADIVRDIAQAMRQPQQSATGITAVVKRTVSSPTPPPTPKAPAPTPNP
jgi:serine/threonine protein kinase